MFLHHKVSGAFSVNDFCWHLIKWKYLPITHQWLEGLPHLQSEVHWSVSWPWPCEVWMGGEAPDLMFSTEIQSDFAVIKKKMKGKKEVRREKNRESERERERRRTRWRVNCGLCMYVWWLMEAVVNKTKQTAYSLRWQKPLTIIKNISWVDGKSRVEKCKQLRDFWLQQYMHN